MPISRFVACLALIAIGAQFVQAQTLPPDPVAEIKPLRLDVVDLGKGLNWQAEGKGPGEFLPYPNAPLTAPLAWGTQTFVGAANGLVYLSPAVAGDDNSRPQWNILKPLYGQAARPLGDQKGMLAIQVGEPFTDSARGIVMLDDSLHVAKELPDVKGYCIGVDASGFWMLDNMQTGSATAKGPTALVHYDTDGNELQRFATDGTVLPKGQIFWAASSPNAIWLAIFSYKGLDKDGNAEWTTRQMVHLDPITGKADGADITAPGGAAFVQQTDKILWLEPPPTGDTWTLQQLDKTTLAESKAGDVNLKGVPDTVTAIHDMTATDRYIWIRAVPTGPLVTINAEGYGGAAASTAGPWPGYQPASYTLWASNVARGDTSGSLSMLAAEPGRIWLLTPDANTVALGDDGNAKAYSLDSAAGTPPTFNSVTAIDGNLYLQLASGELLCVKVAGNSKSIRYPKAGFIPYFVASDKRLWLTNFKQLTAVAPGEPDRTLVIYKEGGKPPTLNLHQMAALDNDLYFLQWDDTARSLVLWRADGTTAQRTSIASWLKRYGGIGKREGWARHWTANAYTSDGQLLFLPPFTPDTKLSIYNSRDDNWDDQPFGKNIVWTAPGPRRLLGFDPDGAAYFWSDTKWEPATKLPSSLKPIGPVFATKKYLYAPTALGLYRVPWAKLVGM